MISRIIWPRGLDPKLHMALNHFVEEVIRETNKAYNLPTYADNATAVAGGLSVGEMYKTATGEVMVVYE